MVDSVTESLINSTEVEEVTQLYPQEIQATNEIVEDVVNFLIDTVTEGITLSDLNTVSFILQLLAGFMSVYKHKCHLGAVGKLSFKLGQKIFLGDYVPLTLGTDINCV